MFTGACTCREKGTEAEKDIQGQVWLGYRCWASSKAGVVLDYIAKKRHGTLEILSLLCLFWLSIFSRTGMAWVQDIGVVELI